MDKLKSLTWKYFWQQKWEEIQVPALFVIGILAFVITSYVLGNTNISCAFNEEISLCSTPIEKFWNGIIWNFAIGSLFILVIIVIMVGNWIMTNWELAEKRARKELKKK